MLQTAQPTTQTLAAKIHQGFTELGIEVNISEIETALAGLKKLGVTNQFANITISGHDYLIRVNGTLWKPFTREREASVLSALAEQKFETNVLLNADGFQICRALPAEHKFSAILASGDTASISKATALVASRLSTLHQLKSPFTMIDSTHDYTIKAMVEIEIKKLESIQIPPAPQSSSSSSAAIPKEHLLLNRLTAMIPDCKKILTVLERSNLARVLSHNDLLTNSLYVDIQSGKVTIVDWEYAANAPRGNDLGKLASRMLDMEELIRAYSQVSEEKLQLADIQLEARLHSILYKFLEISWAVKSSSLQNINNYEERLQLLEKELISVSHDLNARYDALMAPVSSAVSQPSNGDASEPSSHSSTFLAASLLVGGVAAAALLKKLSDSSGSDQSQPKESEDSKQQAERILQQQPSSQSQHPPPHSQPSEQNVQDKHAPKPPLRSKL